MDAYERRVQHLAGQIRMQQDAERYLRQQDAEEARLKHAAWLEERRLWWEDFDHRQKVERDAATAAWKARGPVKYLPGILISLAIVAFFTFIVIQEVERDAHPVTTPYRCPEMYRDSFCQFMAGDHREFYR